MCVVPLKESEVEMLWLLSLFTKCVYCKVLFLIKLLNMNQGVPLVPPLASMNPIGFVYICIQSHFLSVYDIGFSCPKALSKKVSFVAECLLKFFLHRVLEWYYGY